MMPKSNNRIGSKLRIEGVELTQAGRELFKIVKVEPRDEHTKKLEQWLENKGYRMVEVGDGKPRIVNVDAGTGIEP